MKKLFLFFLVATVISGLHGCATVPRPSQVPYKPPLAVMPTPGAAFHTVQKGQTLYRIAKSYHVDVKELMLANGITDPSQLEVGQRLSIPGVFPSHLKPSYGSAITTEQIQRLVGPRQTKYNWRTITVHHSATDQGSAKAFHRDHIRRRMGGLFYHFVIGNGTSTGDGEVEVGWRWKKQVPANRANDIQICLVGNFEKQRVSEAQFHSLVTLIDTLREEYAIPQGSIRKHEDVKGKNTQCPGKNFPFQRLIADLKD